MRPDDVLNEQVALHRWATTTTGAAQLAQAYDRVDIADATATASSYLVTADIALQLQAAAATIPLPHGPYESDGLPSPSGFALFEEPIPLLLFEDDEPTDVPGFMWHTQAYGDDIALLDLFVLLEHTQYRCLLPNVMLTNTVWLTDDTTRRVDIAEEFADGSSEVAGQFLHGGWAPNDDWDEPVSELARIILGFFVWVTQWVTPDDEPASRAAARNAARQSERIPSFVKIVRLRRSDLKASKQPSENKANYTHRFIRAGHWRNQPWGPGRQWRRTQWIAPTIVGDESLPFLPKDTVFVVDR